MASSAALHKATVVAKTVAAFSGTPIGEMVDQLHDLRERKRDLEAKIAAVEGEYKGIEEELMERMETEKTDASRGKKASCSITSNVTGNVTDWDAFNAFIKKTGNFQLYQRRVSDPAFREMLELKGKVPGAEPFVKKRLNVRSLS